MDWATAPSTPRKSGLRAASHARTDRGAAAMARLLAGAIVCEILESHRRFSESACDALLPSKPAMRRASTRRTMMRTPVRCGDSRGKAHGSASRRRGSSRHRSCQGTQCFLRPQKLLFTLFGPSRWTRVTRMDGGNGGFLLLGVSLESVRHR